MGVVELSVDRAGRRWSRSGVSRLVCVASALAAASLVGWIALGLAVAARTVLGGVAIALVVASLDDERPIVRAGAGAAVLVAGGLVAASLSTATTALAADGLTGGLVGVTVCGLLSIGVAAVVTVADRDRLTPRPFLGTCWPVVAGVLVLVVVAVPDGDAAAAVLGVAGILGDRLLDVVLGRDRYGVYAVALLLIAAAWSLRRTVRRLPLLELVPKRRRAETAATLERIDRGCRIGILAGIGSLALVPYVASSFGSGHTTAGVFAFAPDPLSAIGVAIFSTAPLRLALVSILVSSGVLRWAYGLARWLRRTSAEHVARRSAPGLGSVGVVLALSAYVRWRGGVEAVRPEGIDWLSSFMLAVGPTGTGAVVLAFAGGFVVATLVALGGFGALLLPETDVGPALAGAGAFALAVVALALGWTVSAFVTAALAMACWDAGVYGRTVVEGVPAGRTTRAELTHASAALAVGGLLVVLAVVTAGTLGVLPTVSPTAGRLLAMSLVGVGAVLLLSRL